MQINENKKRKDELIGGKEKKDSLIFPKEVKRGIFIQLNEVSPEPELGPGWRKVEIKVDNRVVKTRSKYWNPEGEERSYKEGN